MAAYIVATLEITDPEIYGGYSRQVASTVAKHGGRFIVRGGPYDVLEGDFPKGRRLVVVEFPDLATARRWYISPEYAALIPLRQKSTRGAVLLVQGTEQANGSVTARA